jgi:hypothetical protein
LLREIRNDESHRCEVINFDHEKIINDYELLKIKWGKYRIKHNKFPIKTDNELKMELKYRLIEFIKEKNYQRVRKILRNVKEQIENYCGQHAV